MNKIYKIAIYIAGMFVAISCNHKDLCYDHRDHAHRYHIKVIADYRYDWEERCKDEGVDWKKVWPKDYIPYDELRPGKPTGLRVVNYDEAGVSNIHNIGADGGVVNLYAGYNDILFYNNDTEYIIFSRHDNGATTRATTRTRTRASYISSEFANEGEETVNAPDMLYANYCKGYWAEKLARPAEFKVTLQPLVYKYKVRYEFKSGLKYVAMARGALSGMAKYVLMNTGETSDTPATILYDAELTDYGVRAVVTSFGIPGYPNNNYMTRTTNKHALNLEVMLRNGKTLNFNFDVTDQVAAQPHGGVIVVKDIVIEEDVGSQGSGAFDVTVDDWGDYNDIELPL